MSAIANFALKRPVLAGSAFLAASVAASYLLALAGDPRLAWIWHNLIGVK